MRRGFARVMDHREILDIFARGDTAYVKAVAARRTGTAR
jgi:hypothetical protein